jgi:hypothetical protein
MMFPKDHSNTGGECLCKSCRWCCDYKIQPNSKIPIGYCILDDYIHANVGVCNDYEGYKEDNNG